jgi:hypothetical protein
VIVKDSRIADLIAAKAERLSRPMTQRNRRRWVAIDDAMQAKKATRGWRRSQREKATRADRLMQLARVADGVVEAPTAVRENARRELERLEKAPEIAAELEAKRAERRAQHEANRRRNLEAMA